MRNVFRQFVPVRPVRAKLHAEVLESRRLMDAAGLLPASALSDPRHILIGYRDQPAIVHQVSVPTAASVDELLATLKADRAVAFAEPDFQVQAAVLTNDPYLGHDWGLNNTGQSGGTGDADIDAPEAWNISTGSTRAVVAVIDSGVDYTHPDLYQNIWINQAEIPATVRSLLVDVDSDSLITFHDLNDARNQGTGKITDLDRNGRIDGRDLLYSSTSGGWADGASNDGDSYVDDLIGWNFVTNTNNPNDDNSHGTHVAGTIAASGNNGAGVAGVLWKAQVAALKFLDSAGSGYISAAANAINYAVSKGIKVSNNSWGGGGYSQAVFDAISNARAHGHVFVAAAGNGGSDGVGDNNDVTPDYPAAYNLDNILTVAATDSSDRLASFSNYGAATVDIAAPGVSILSTVPGGYSYMNGTSMATPHATGVVALVQGLNPAWSYSQVITQVQNSTDKVAALTGKVATGARLNALNALTSAPVDSSGPRVVSAAPLTSKPVSAVRLTFSEAIDPATFTVTDITRFSGPLGGIRPTSVAVVAGSANKQFDVKFALQSTAGAYSFSVGPDVKDTAGNQMDQDQDGVRGEATADRYSAQFVINPSYAFASNPYAAIRDRASTVVSMTVNQDISIADLNVRLDIAHTYDSDLYIHLVAPDGTDVPLSRFRGGSGDNFKGTVFDDEAATAISSGAAPFSGSFRPEYALSNFDGKNARGTWRLYVEDWYAGDTGRINSWTLTFEAAAISSQRSSAVQSNPLVITTASTSEALTPAAAQQQDQPTAMDVMSAGQRDDQVASRRIAHVARTAVPLDELALALARRSQSARPQFELAVDQLMAIWR